MLMAPERDMQHSSRAPSAREHSECAEDEAKSDEEFAQWNDDVEPFDAGQRGMLQEYGPPILNRRVLTRGFGDGPCINPVASKPPVSLPQPAVSHLYPTYTRMTVSGHIAILLDCNH